MLLLIDTYERHHLHLPALSGHLLWVTCSLIQIAKSSILFVQQSVKNWIIMAVQPCLQEDGDQDQETVMDRGADHPVCDLGMR
jgi:hypothetical protein